MAEPQPEQPRPEEQELLEKLRRLPPDRVAEVEDFIDFLRLRNEDRSLTQVTMKMSEKAFGRVWDNPDDADYDRL